MRPDWYLSTVKEKENRSWTPDEMVKVYTMRISDHLPSEVIAKKMHVSKCQVYNITRIMRKALREKCYQCGHKLTKKELKSKKHLIGLCSKCRIKAQNYKHKLRQKYLNKKMCGYCGQHEVVENKKACIYCISATHRRREKLGICGNCGKEPIRAAGKALCINCVKITRNTRTITGSYV